MPWIADWPTKPELTSDWYTSGIAELSVPVVHPSFSGGLKHSCTISSTCSELHHGIRKRNPFCLRRLGALIDAGEIDRRIMRSWEAFMVTIRSASPFRLACCLTPDNTEVRGTATSLNRECLIEWPRISRRSTSDAGQEPRPGTLPLSQLSGVFAYIRVTASARTRQTCEPR